MKLSLHWLNLYIDLKDYDIEKLANTITMSICEIEDIYRVADWDSGIVTGKIVETTPVPGTQLTVCNVDAGKEILEIVTAAKNVKKGNWVPVARIGAGVFADGKKITVEKKTIRGVESHGMLCSSKELGIEHILGETDGILILEELEDGVFSLQNFLARNFRNLKESKPGKTKKKTFRAGTPLKDVLPLSDVIFEIDNKSITHRPDLWGHWGFALELGALLKKKLRYDLIHHIRSFQNSLMEDSSLPDVEIRIHRDSALAYSGAVCDRVSVGTSPFWLKYLLSVTGQKSINNIVDISNFVMYELGQPNHAFDFKKLSGSDITVDRTEEEVSFTALDKETYRIPPESVMIFSGKEPVALAGIIGGLDTSIQESTTAIFIESATFPRELIRKTISRTGIRTESARRFEKGQDPVKSRLGLYRFLQLLSYLQPQVRVGKVRSIFTVPEYRNNRIRTSLTFLQKKLGFPVKEKEVISILKRLHFDVKKEKKELVITVPTFRSYYDITIQEDIVEEIGRIYGYDNIIPVAPEVEMSKPELPYKRYLERQVKNFLSSNGPFFETMNYSFATLEENQSFGYEGIQLLNPSQKHKDRMRVSLVWGLLEQIQQNIHRYEEAGLYELGRVFLPENGTGENPEKHLPQERQKLTLVFFSENYQRYRNYLFPGDTEELGVFLYVRDIFEKMLKYFNIAYEVSRLEDNFLYHPNCQIRFSHGETFLGSMGILNPELKIRYEFPEAKTVILADFDFDNLAGIYDNWRRKKESNYKPPSTAPGSTFDFTVLLPVEESTMKPVNHIKTLAFPEIQKVEIVTIYTGPPIPEGKKSVTYRVRCLDMQPIPGERLQTILDTIVKLLEEKGYPLRT